MVAWLDKLTNLSSSIRAEVSSPESSKKETQLGFVGMGPRTRAQRSSWITVRANRKYSTWTINAYRTSGSQCPVTQRLRSWQETLVQALLGVLWGFLAGSATGIHGS